MKILVLGIGQVFRGDDAAGLEAVRTWQEKSPQTSKLVRVETREVPDLSLLDLLEDFTSLIIVDAISSTGPRKKPFKLDLEDLESFTQYSKTTHGWNIAETIRIWKVLTSQSGEKKIIFIGIPGNVFALGSPQSSDTKKNVQRAVKMIESTIRELLRK